MAVTEVDVTALSDGQLLHGLVHGSAVWREYRDLDDAEAAGQALLWLNMLLDESNRRVTCGSR